MFNGQIGCKFRMEFETCCSINAKPTTELRIIQVHMSFAIKFPNYLSSSQKTQMSSQSSKQTPVKRPRGSYCALEWKDWEDQFIREEGLKAGRQVCVRI